MISVLLVDDHLSFRQPLAFMLAREADIQVIGQAGSVEEARKFYAEADVALVDLGLPDGDGVNLIRELRGANRHCMAVALTASVRRTDVARAVEAGAAGVLHKSLPVTDVVTAVHRLRAGESLLSPPEMVELLRLIGQQRDQDRLAQAAIVRLTPRECEVLQTLAKGLSDREIGERLQIGTETVRTHMVNLLQKLGVESRLQALVFAVRYGLVHIR